MIYLTHIKKILFVILGSTIALPIVAADEKIPCEPVTIHAKNPASLDLVSLEFNFAHKINNGEIAQDLKGNPVFEVTQVAVADASALRETYFSKAAENIPTDKCDKHVAHSYKIFPLSDGKAKGQFSYRFEDWFCGWTDSKCTKMERQKVGQTPHVTCSKHLIPKCTVKWKDNFAHVPVVYSCKAKTTYMNFQKTFTVYTIFTPTIDAEKEIINVNGATDIDDRGGVPDWLLNIVGVLTLDVGSKWIRDNYKAKLSDIRTSLPSINESFLAKNSDFEIPNLQLTSAKFSGDSSRLTMVTESKAEMRLGRTCQFQEFLLKSQLFQ